MDYSNLRIFSCYDNIWLPCNELASRLGVSMDALICEALTFYYQQQVAALQAGNLFPVSQPNAAIPATPQDALVPPEQNGPPVPQAFPVSTQPLPTATDMAPAERISPAAPALNQQRIPSIPGHSPLPPPPVPAPRITGQRAPVPPQRRPASIFEEINAPQPPRPMQLASLSTPDAPPLNPNQSNLPGQTNFPPSKSPRNARANPADQSNLPGHSNLPGANGALPPLYIVFANQKYHVNKDKYIIGRASQYADLVIRDPNVSRKHCAVVFKDGAYYIHDLGSTNGIEYHGQQIETKRINEGDDFNICEFHFQFTYKP